MWSWSVARAVAGLEASGDLIADNGRATEVLPIAVGAITIEIPTLGAWEFAMLALLLAMLALATIRRREGANKQGWIAVWQPGRTHCGPPRIDPRSRWFTGARKLGCFAK